MVIIVKKYGSSVSFYCKHEFYIKLKANTSGF
jgi:hypothetical protein